MSLYQHSLLGDRMQTHCIPREIPYGKSSWAYWSLKPSGTILVFVHGFGGSSTGTWRQFPDMLIKHDMGGICDIVFYGYESMRSRTRYSALDLLGLLDNLCTSPAPVINSTVLPQMQRPAEFSFNRVVLISHSLGGLVCRQALVEACYSKRVWLDRIALVLFAPAHLGADVIKLANSAFPIIGALMKFRWQSLLDLECKSETLAALLKDTESLISDGNQSLIAKKVILADHDDIVSPNRFLSDPNPAVFHGKNHFEVCKPDLSFSAPLDELLGVL